MAGQRGNLGPRGLRGEQGLKGEKGDKGDRGERGATGEVGLVSAQYPLKYDAKKKHLSIDLSKLGGTKTAPILYDGGGGLGEAFKVVSVSGQSDLVAVQYDAETLRIVAGAGINLLTDPATNSLTIINTGGGGTGTVAANRFFFGPTAPGDPIPGDRWVDSRIGILFTYIDDGNDQEWVEFGAGPVGATGPMGATGATGRIAFTFDDIPPATAHAGDQWLHSINGSLFTWVEDDNSAQWVELGAGPVGATGPIGETGATGRIAFTFDDVPPATAHAGDQWLHSVSGSLFTWVIDGDSAQWVELGAGPVGATGERGPTGSTGTVFGYWGSFWDTTTQTNAGITAANVMRFNNMDLQSNGAYVTAGSRLTVTNTGVYNIQFSAQFDKTDSGRDDVEIWLSKNGTNVPDTATIIGADGNNAKIVAAWNFVIPMNANDYAELYWHSDDIQMRVYARPAATNPTRPSIPSIIATVTQVA